MLWTAVRTALSLLPLVALMPAKGAGSPLTQLPGSRLEVYLVTIGPGDRAASRFGHSVIRIVDPEAGTDLSHSFGQSDPSDPGQIVRLIQGLAEVGVGALPTDEVLERYREQGRTIWSQSLALSPSERHDLQSLLHQAHGSFRYDFFLENCTTRLRDALDTVLKGALSRATADDPASATWREHASRFTGSSFALYLLTNAAMSGVVDRPINQWEEMFLPALLRERLREVTTVGESGEIVPLVSSEEVWQAADEVARLAESNPSPWHLHLPIGIALGIMIAATGSMAASNPRAANTFRIAAGGWLVATGLLGVALTSLWAFTGQWLAYGNENVLQANPLALLVAAIAWGGSEEQRGSGRWLAVALAAFSLLGVVLKQLPDFAQDNGAVLVLAVPVNLGVAWGLWRQ